MKHVLNCVENDAGCSHIRYSLFPFSSWWNPDFSLGIYPSLPWSYTSIKLRSNTVSKWGLKILKVNFPRTIDSIKNSNKFYILLSIRLFLQEACNPNQGSDTCRKISRVSMEKSPSYLKEDTRKICFLSFGCYGNIWMLSLGLYSHGEASKWRLQWTGSRNEADPHLDIWMVGESEGVSANTLVSTVSASHFISLNAKRSRYHSHFAAC